MNLSKERLVELKALSAADRVTLKGTELEVVVDAALQVEGLLGELAVAQDELLEAQMEIDSLIFHIDHMNRGTA